MTVSYLRQQPPQRLDLLSAVQMRIMVTTAMTALAVTTLHIPYHRLHGASLSNPGINLSRYGNACHVSILDTRIKIAPVYIKSSLASITGKFSGSINAAGKVSSGNGEFDINLSSTGLAEVGSFLPLISSGKLTNKDKSFRLIIQLSPAGSNVKALPLT